ncbi:hypothetical protein [Infirmifilum sp.]|uniref:hypothetical protein n=1 Tax=Infirmifilum sp. TaxID=2856575 RepID=UPI003D145AA8
MQTRQEAEGYYIWVEIFRKSSLGVEERLGGLEITAQGSETLGQVLSRELRVRTAAVLDRNGDRLPLDVPLDHLFRDGRYVRIKVLLPPNYIFLDIRISGTGRSYRLVVESRETLGDVLASIDPGNASGTPKDSLDRELPWDRSLGELFPRGYAETRIIPASPREVDLGGARRGLSDPFLKLKEKYAGELAKLGFSPIEGSISSEWIWEGEFCGFKALIVIPPVPDSENPVQLWVSEDLQRIINWFRLLNNKKKLRERTYRFVCPPHHGQPSLETFLHSILKLIRKETGYTCPELRR